MDGGLFDGAQQFVDAPADRGGQERGDVAQGRDPSLHIDKLAQEAREGVEVGFHGALGVLAEPEPAFPARQVGSQKTEAGGGGEYNVLMLMAPCHRFRRINSRRRGTNWRTTIVITV